MAGPSPLPAAMAKASRAPTPPIHPRDRVSAAWAVDSATGTQSLLMREGATDMPGQQPAPLVVRLPDRIDAAAAKQITAAWPGAATESGRYLWPAVAPGVPGREEQQKAPAGIRLGLRLT